MTANIVIHTVKDGKDVRVEQNVEVPPYAPADAGRFVVIFCFSRTEFKFQQRNGFRCQSTPLHFGQELDTFP
ncbi:hypothetical protein [Janthinobacterium sp. FW305-128]|uniref:hypothetical protein n=1 Tax=Janthinobacterium sp. FW305-128 TaxID=2775055 RepID=UPI001E358327|nr:hypothetical protein [Janthinobacterium sp. FW305-128]MCC7680794.1 hypothetical protein [Janthinobacterium sp. FW305-128]